MNQSTPCLLFVGRLFSLIALSLAPAKAFTAEPLQCGFAVTDITPPVGYRMSGYFYERFSTGTSNPLEAKAIVLQQGDVRFAWVFCDLLGVPATLTSAIRDDISAKLDIPRENIFIAATHTHTGPLYFGPLRNYFHNAAVEKNGKDKHEAVDYSQELRTKLVDVAAEAAAALEPTELVAGIAEQPGLAFNRRYVMRDGTVRTNPGKLNPDIVRPAGPVDPEVGLLQFRRDNKPVAGLTIFALHCDTTGGTEYAADFPFHIHNALREQFGPDYVSIFGTGTCGNINHFDLIGGKQDKGVQEAKRLGDTLAAAATSAFNDLATIESPNLASVSETLSVPLQHYTDAEMATARASLVKVGTKEMPMLEQVEAVKIVGIDELDTEKLPMDVQAFRLSDDVALVSLPGELFVELGLEIKEQSPFKTTYVVELANDYPGYIPTKQGFAEGSYEPTNSKLAPGGGELLRDAAIKLLKKLHAQ